MTNRKWRPPTQAAQGLGWTNADTGAVILPIDVSTTFRRDDEYNKRHGRDYIRDQNPTFEQPEQLLAQLEGGAEARLFASGMAAAAAVFQSLEPGDHVVASHAMYFGVTAWLRSTGMRWGLQVDFVDTSDLGKLQAAVVPGRTKLVWIETPCNPTWAVTDIAAAADIAHRAGAKLCADNTVSTPVLTRPLEMGADYVMHSATKYLNGHSDVLAGALVTVRQDDQWALMCDNRHLGGAVLGSFEAFLLMRGMRTLFLRVRECSANAMAVASHLDGHPALESVEYPGLPSHRGHKVAAQQMAGGFGGMLSVCVKGGVQSALAVARACRLFKQATSLGGVESLIEHRATVEGPDSPTPENLLRLSVGIEDSKDIIEDLEAALQTVQI